MAREPDTAAQHPPLGRHGHTRTFEARSQRERLLCAVATISMEKSYAAMTIADIVRHAGCSRRTFYDNFRSKHDAFLQALDAISDQCRAAVAEAFLSGESWRDQTRAGIEALLRFIAANPTFAHMVYVEIPAAGREGIRRPEEALRSFEVFVAGALERTQDPVPPRLAQMIGGAIQTLIRDFVTQGRCTDLPDLLPDALYICFVAFLGPAEAAREAGIPPPALPDTPLSAKDSRVR